MFRAIASILLPFALTVLTVTAALAQQPIRIVAFGGSTTLGKGVPHYDAYPAKLEKALKAKGYNVVVTNAGVAGDKTADGVSRLDRAVPQGSNIVIVEYGVNDHYANVDPAKTRENLEIILGRLRERQAEVLLISYRGAKGMQTLAQKYGASFSDFAFAAQNDLQYRLSNDPQLRTQGVAHFNAAGYDKIVERILPAVEELIARTRR